MNELLLQRILDELTTLREKVEELVIENEALSERFEEVLTELEMERRLDRYGED